MVGSSNLGLLRILFSYSLLVLALTLVSERGNLLFFLRTLLLALPGYLPAGVQLVNPNLYYSTYEKVSQTLDVSLTCYAITSLALASSEFAIHLAQRLFDKPSVHNDGKLFQEDFYFFFPIVPVLAMAYYIARIYGASLFEASYASETGISGLGNANAIAITLLFILYAHVRARPSAAKRGVFAVCAVAVLVYGMLIRGGRQDVISGLIGFFIVHAVVARTSPSVTPRALALGAAGVLFMEYFGFLRSQVISTSVDFGDQLSQMVVFYTDINDVFALSTFSPIATTFANTVYAVQHGLAEHLWGRSYLEYIPRTPPEFLFPGRPADYAWIFTRWRLAAGGGFFELAEVYFNFGPVGALFVPGTISFVVAGLYFKAASQRSKSALYLLFGILSIFLRGALYQTFAYYKAFVTAFLLMVMLESARAVLSSPARQGHVRLPG